MAELGVRRCRPLLGTFVEIAVPHGYEPAIDAGFEAVAHVHARMSFHQQDSDLARLRSAPIGQFLRVDPDTAAVLRFAKELHAASAGLFDVAVGARLVELGLLPCPAGFRPEDLTGTTADIEIRDDDRVRCLRPMLIDLGGIAKGYAVDRAAAALVMAGVPSALVNAGGDLRVVGDLPQIIHLREADGSLAGVVEVANCAVATSGGITDGTASPHLDGERRPIAVRRAVSIVAGQCMVADAMTKIALADERLATAMLSDLGGEILHLPGPVRFAA
jgi:thiamine biosynthesis lipoprotein